MKEGQKKMFSMFSDGGGMENKMGIPQTDYNPKKSGIFFNAL